MREGGKRWGWRRMRLRRADGRVYLDRWGFDLGPLGVFVHRMAAPDPGIDLHDHPFPFVSFVLAGAGYEEERVDARVAEEWARFSLRTLDEAPRGQTSVRHRWRWRALGLHECHRITRLLSQRVWTLVVRGPRVRSWGFFLPSGWVDEETYDRTVRVHRRDMWDDTGDSRLRAMWGEA